MTSILDYVSAVLIMPYNTLLEKEREEAIETKRLVKAKTTDHYLLAS